MLKNYKFTRRKIYGGTIPIKHTIDNWLWFILSMIVDILLFIENMPKFAMIAAMCNIVAQFLQFYELTEVTSESK